MPEYLTYYCRSIWSSKGRYLPTQSMYRVFSLVPSRVAGQTDKLSKIAICSSQILDELEPHLAMLQPRSPCYPLQDGRGKKTRAIGKEEVLDLRKQRKHGVRV